MENKAKSTRSSRLSFLKVLEGDFSKQLSMPPGFTDVFAGDIPQWLILEVSGTRQCWKVDVDKDENGKLYLSDGWSDFVKANYVQVGSSLVFELKEKHIVTLKLYDKDGCQIVDGEISEFKEDEVGSSECKPTNSKTHNEEEESGLSQRMPPGSHGVQQKQHLGTDEHQGIPEKQNSGENKRETAGVSSVEMSVSFTVTYQEAGHFNRYLKVPSTIAEEKNLSNKGGVMLNDQNGRSWLIKLTTRQNGGVYFTKGWREFLVVNGIKDGDFLTFEFFSNDKIKVRVDKIFHGDNPPQIAGDSRSTGTTSEQAAGLAGRDEPAADCNISKIPTGSLEHTEEVRSKFMSTSFSRIWTHTSNRYDVHFPKWVAREQNLHRKTEVVLFDEKGKRWKVSVKTRLDGRVAMTDGWRDFWTCNNLASGDVLHFKFISDCMIKVDISRASQVNHSTGGVTIKEEVVEYF